MSNHITLKKLVQGGFKMNKLNSKLVIVLTLTLIIGIGSTVFALPNSSSDSANTSGNKTEAHKHKDSKLLGVEVMTELGLSKEDVEAARKSGKSIYDLAKEKKGMTPDQVKALIIKTKINNINKKVSEGKITKEKATTIIPKIQARIEKWDGRMKPFEESSSENKKTKN